MNFIIFGLAVKQQEFERLEIESRVRRYTGFNLEPLGEYDGEEIEKTVKVESQSGIRLRVYDEILDRIKAGQISSVVGLGSDNNPDQSKTMTKLNY